MDLIDIVVAVTVALFVVFLLYRSVWKKRGECAGCEVSDCGPKKHVECDSPLNLSDLEAKNEQHNPGVDNPR